MVEEEQVADSAISETNDWIITGEDTPKNANKARVGIKNAFPDVDFLIKSKPNIVRGFAPQGVGKGKVLIRVTVPKGKDINHVDLMRVWSDSLNKAE